ncbi:DUF4190 domain-containing protein [Actinocorallia longicatena]|uniref:DUF4190 domain-containing protein n=1 Tax=Actinocorallia longicatena TaxID=111803 RepID=A0ABP6QAF7_9ACTN
MRRTNPYAVASLVCGVLWGCWIGSVLAIFFGHLARRQIRRHDERGAPLALAGLVLGYTALVVLVFALIQGGTWVTDPPT